MELTAALLFLLLAIAAAVVRKTYFYMPRRELKRQAEKQDKLAARLYQAAAYGSSLQGLLVLFTATTGAIGCILLSRSAPLWLSFFIIAGIATLLTILPSTRVGKVGAQLTSRVTPLLARVLNYAHPVLSKTVGAAERRYKTSAHTGLYERDDLLRLIEQQQLQVDSRLRPEELEIAKRALSFEAYRVGDIVTPRSEVASALAQDTLGPILIDELHKSKQRFVLVRESKKGPIVGNLQVTNLGIDSEGLVQDAMDKTVYYLHENDSLSEALHAFFVTNYPMFVVVNSFEEYVGIVTMESILKQLMGHMPGDEFDQYSDRTLVAARHATQTETLQVDKDAPVKTDEKVVE
jgi:CBS domain containing-hemolysin-like protein